MKSLSLSLLFGLLSSQVLAQNLTTVQQQEVADETIFDVAHQTVASQRPYYGWNVTDPNFQPWSVATSGSQKVPQSSVYGDVYTYSLDNSTTSTSAGTTYSLITINPKNGAQIDYTPRQTNNTGAFQKILIIWMENMEWSWTESDPNWQTVTSLGLTMTNYSGISHPSEPNYAAVWGGDFFGLNSDNYFTINATNLGDLIEHKGLNWKSYQENYVPGPNNTCNPSMGIGPGDKFGSGTQLYQRKHNPQILYSNIGLNNTRCYEHIVGHQQFITDLLNNQMPEVSFYTPNIVNDGHDDDQWNDVRTTSSGWWVKLFLNTYLPYLQQQNVLVQLTFDEADYPDFLNPYPALYPVANQIPSILYGPSSLITPNTTYSGYINHYGVLDAIEQNFALGSLGRNDTVPENGGQNFFAALQQGVDTTGQTFGALVDPTGVAAQIIGSEDLIPASP